MSATEETEETEEMVRRVPRRFGRGFHHGFARAVTAAAAVVTVTAASALVACAPELVPPDPATRAVTLPDGGELRVPERATRILPMSSASTDYVLALVPRERVVAVPVEAPIYSSSLIRGGAWPEDRTVPEFSAEAMLSVDPDLVIAHRWQVPAEALDVVEASGVAVLRLGDETSFERILETVQLVASAVDEPRAGAHLAHELKQRAAALVEDAGDRAGLRALSYTNFGSGGWTAGRDTSANALIEMCGMVNAAAADGRAGHETIDIERLLVLDPDVIVLAKGNEEYSPSRAYLENEEALATLRALRRGWIVEIPSDLFSANSQYVVDAAEELAAAVDALLAEEE